MKVFEIRDDWGMDHLQLGERPEPDPAPGQVKLKMKAASLNSRDLIVPLRGYGRATGELPLIPLSDGVGEVVAVGDGVNQWAIGDRVCPAFFQSWDGGGASAERLAQALGGPLDGVMAEYMCVDQNGVVAAPKHLSDAEVATLACAGVTAWSALVTNGGIKAGQRVLIQGSGGVALFALAFAKMHGAHVTMISSSDEKIEKLKAMGADAAVNYKTEPDWGKPAKVLSEQDGFDHIVELGGEATLPQSLRCIRPGGSIYLIGVLSGLDLSASLGPVVTRQIRLQGITVGSRESMAAMAQAIGQHGMRPVIDQSFDFDALKDGMAALKSGGHMGKICLAF
ncbi:MAG: NAD(P)-dependent alcohol dehydrogenase [Pseudomonadota bacterium]